jgi:LEA14-like dessication related protein
MRCAVALLLLALGCDRPAPPTLTPERVRLLQLTNKKVDLDVTLAVDNPNKIDLVAHTLSAHVVVGGSADLGTVEIPVTTVFPAGKSTRLDVPLTVQVSDIASLTALALTSDGIPFSVDGKVGVGGETIHVDLPYRLEGAVPRADLVRAAAASIPGLGH